MVAVNKSKGHSTAYLMTAPEQEASLKKWMKDNKCNPEIPNQPITFKKPNLPIIALKTHKIKINQLSSIDIKNLNIQND